MAFKIDFAKLNRNVKDRVEDLYDHHDMFHFAKSFKGDTLACGAVNIGLDQRRMSNGLSDLVVPARKGARTFNLVLVGQRADDWNETVSGPLAARRTSILEEVESPSHADWDRADGLRTDVEVEGFWKKRWFKDRFGNWSHSLDFHVARFTIGGVSKGRIPAMK